MMPERMKPPLVPPPPEPRLSMELSTAAEEPERVPFFRPLSQKIRKNTWVISLFFILHVAAFVATMAVNDCLDISHGQCALKPLGWFSFQPLSENPLLGPSASTLDKMGALRQTLLSNHHQLWRLFTSPWLHAGVLHLVINLSCIIFLGIHLEQEFGSMRILVIYVLSAITGSLVAALFLKDRPSVTSSGALFGLLGLMLSGLIWNWKLYTKKFAALVIFVMVSITNLVLGLVPNVNNFANLGGFTAGFLASFVLLFKPEPQKVPFTKAGLYEFGAKHSAKVGLNIDRPLLRGVSLVIFCLLVSGVIIAVLRTVNANEYCTWCQYFDCLPTRWWSCSDKPSQCETMISSGQMTLACLDGGDFRVFPFANISNARAQDLCNLICS